MATQPAQRNELQPELQPVFTVTVWLDGDDDPKEATENLRWLILRTLKDDAVVKSAVVEVNA